MSHHKHVITHVEIPAKDIPQAGKFYADLFGWKVEEMQGFEYALFDYEGGPGGGFPKVDGKDVNPRDVLIYISTDDIEASLAKAEVLGGKKVMGRTEVPGHGWYGVFEDPTGNRIALWTSARQNVG